MPWLAWILSFYGTLPHLETGGNWLVLMNGSVICHSPVLWSAPSLLTPKLTVELNLFNSDTLCVPVSVCVSVRAQGPDQVLKYSGIFTASSSLCSGSCRYFVLILSFQEYIVGNYYVHLISFLLISVYLVRSLLLLHHTFHHLFDFLPNEWKSLITHFQLVFKYP